jgi:hypothetical protein
MNDIYQKVFPIAVIILKSGMFATIVCMTLLLFYKAVKYFDK